jgi:FkbM family methyltransferase
LNAATSDDDSIRFKIPPRIDQNQRRANVILIRRRRVCDWWWTTGAVYCRFETAVSDTNTNSQRDSGKTQNPESLPVFHAPNGLEIFHHAAAETKYVYQEIFEERVYFRHNVNLLAGETVFDIGANIGLFTLFVKENFPDIRVHAFEPSPTIFRVLKANTARYGDSVSLHPCGVAERSGEAKFTFYPNYSIMSGLHAGGEQDQATLRNGILSSLKEQAVDPSLITDRSVDRMVKVALGQKREHLCQLRTISEILDEADVRSIGLLKIDAEGSELDILAGIRNEHWSGIRQIVMEIHDPDGGIRTKVSALLEKHCFKTVLEEEKRLSGSGIINCYARRV